jgi:hypothetical protein
MVKFEVLAVTVLVLANAHICTIFPKQRGAFSIDDTAEDSCYRRTDYCGGVPIADPSAENTFVAGTSAQFSF